MDYSIQMKILLAGIKPSVWRRVMVNADLSLEQVSSVIQSVMPWNCGERHQFIVRDRLLLAPSLDGDREEDLDKIRDYEETRIGDLLSEKGDFIKYEYDFTDHWIHNIAVEKIYDKMDDRAARYITGKCMAPPEGCGGSEGYQRLKEIMADPSHAEYSQMAELLGMEDDEIFDPTYIGCDSDEIDEELYDI